MKEQGESYLIIIILGPVTTNSYEESLHSERPCQPEVVG